MTNYAALKAEDAKVIYNGQTDAQRSAAINNLTVSTTVAVDPASARKALMFTATNDLGWLADVAGLLGANGTASASGANANGTGAVAPITVVTRRLAFTLYALLSTPTSIPLTGPNITLVGNLLDALVAANVITSAGRTAVQAVPISNVSWPIFYGFPQGVNPGELAAARLFNG